MTSLSRIALSAAALATLASTPNVRAQQAMNSPDTSGYIAANGLNYWFEIHGKGEPLLLLQSMRAVPDEVWEAAAAAGVP